MPFNVGDKVRFTDRCGRGWFFGPDTIYKTGVVTSIGPRGNVRAVSVDNYPYRPGTGYINSDDQLELIEAEQPAANEAQSTTFYTLVYKTRHISKRVMGFETEHEFEEKKRNVLQQGGTVFGEKKLKLSNV